MTWVLSPVDLILQLFIFCIGLLAINPRTKFDVSDFSRSLDMEGVPKFKSRSRDVGHAPFDPQNVVIYVTFYKFDILVKFRYYSFIGCRVICKNALLWTKLVMPPEKGFWGINGDD